MSTRKIHCFLALFICLLLAGCRPAATQPAALPSTTPTPLASLTSSDTPVPGDTITPLPSPAPSETASPLSPIATSTETAQPFLLCSPLAEETIYELWQIISNPYAPPLSGPTEAGHHGVDFAHYRRKQRLAIDGEIVQSVLPGVVAAAVTDRLPYGNMLIIETPYSALPADLADALAVSSGASLYLLYAHLQDPPTLAVGDEVACGAALGAVGATGYDIVNAHLHLETRLGPPGTRFPEGLVFYDTSAVQSQMDNYRRWRTSGEFTHFDPMSLFAAYLAWRGEPLPSEALTPTP